MEEAARLKTERALEELERRIRAGHKFPFGGRVMVDEEEIRSLIDELRQGLPEDIQRAQHLLAERDALLAEARAEADRIVSDAQGYVEKLAQESAVTERARSIGQDIVDRAEATAQTIRAGAREYADQVMEEAVTALAKLAAQVERDRGELHQDAGQRRGSGSGR